MVEFFIGLVIGVLATVLIKDVCFDIRIQDKKRNKPKKPLHFKGEL